MIEKLNSSIYTLVTYLSDIKQFPCLAVSAWFWLTYPFSSIDNSYNLHLYFVTSLTYITNFPFPSSNIPSLPAYLTAHTVYQGLLL